MYLFSFRASGGPWTDGLAVRTVCVRSINRRPSWPVSRLRVPLDDHTLDLSLDLTRLTGAARTWCMRTR
jgi:hypothetical protein